MEATPMKLLTVFSTTTLAVLLGISAPVFVHAQDEHPQEEKRAQPDAKAAQDEKQQDKQVDKDADKQVDKTKEDKQVENNNKDKQAEKEKVTKSTDQTEKTAHQDERVETQSARPEGKPGGRIPDDRFRANFGREHTFTIGHPVVVAGVPRFQYGGYWFVMVQPWPVGWAYTDVVYVDYIGGGYYLLSPVHPGVQISINVVL
jgi:hypothetical protein